MGILNKIKKFKWFKQPNGNYTIKDVPIFCTFTSDDRGKVDKSDAKEIIENFQEKADSGRYPRIHIGHQESGSITNKPGAGFMDNLRFDGKKHFFADLVEVKEKVFQQFAQLFYSGHSVEYNPQEKCISSLALLESREPYFGLPMIAVDPSSSIAFGGNNRVYHFQKYCKEENMSIFKFKKDKYCDKDDDDKKQMYMDGDPEDENEMYMDEEIEDDGGEESFDDPMGEPDMAEPAPAPVEPIAPEPAGDPRMDMVVSSIQELTGMMKQLFAPAQAATPASLGEEPGSIAMQKDPEVLQFMKEMREENKELKKALFQLTGQKAMDSTRARLKRICENSTLNFQQEWAVLEQIEDPKARKAVLDGVEARAMQYSSHPVSGIPIKFAAEEKNEIFKCVKGKSTHVRNVAKQAFQAYINMLNQTDQISAKRFRATWSDPKTFVAHVAEMEEVQPGYFRTLTRN